VGVFFVSLDVFLDGMELMMKLTSKRRFGVGLCGRGFGVGLVLAAVSCSFVAALGQVRAERLYNGMNRPLSMVVEIPAGVEGKAKIEIFAYSGGEPVMSAEVEAGAIDLAEAFPALWSSPLTEAHLAQLVVDGVKVGAPVVLQPMSGPPAATGMVRGPDGRGVMNFAPSRPGIFGYRTYTDMHVVMDTSEGEIEIRLRPDAAPNHAFNFRHLVEGGFYTDIKVHRVIGVADGATEGFVVQAGDPLGSGGGGPGYNIDLEPSKLVHDYGVVSMARTNDPNTGGSQFFICLGKQSTASLNGLYTSFGEVIQGRDAVERMQATPVTGDRPVNPPVIHSARLVDAPPVGEAAARIKNPRLESPGR